MRDRRRALQCQAAYYVATGAFPLLTRRGFERLTGAKHDWWLVQMVGLLAVAIGLSLAVAAGEERETRRSAETLAVLSASAFAAIDVIYVAKRRISPVYLVDAAVEAAILFAATGAIPP